MADYVITTTMSSTKSGTYTVTATANRNIVTADVLDYDGYMGNYALIWKKITITHSQKNDTTATTESWGGAIYVNAPFGDMSSPPTYIPHEKFDSKATRTVEFYLTYCIDGKKVDKLLCSCSMEATYVSETDVDSILHQTFTGERVWGCSIQVSAEFITYQFRKEIPASSDEINWGGGYDGNCTFESWMSDRDENSVWKMKSNVVGLINILDGADSEVGYLKEEEYALGAAENPLSSGHIYSVGVVNT
jgi:hypothetical protein